MTNTLLTDIFLAYYDARKNKRSTINALAFEVEYEKQLLELYQDILTRQYAIRPSICFIVNKPVKREVFAADFRDRVIHHLLFNYLNPLFDSQFIFDTYSCRKHKGTLCGIARVNHFIRSSSENYSRDSWILKADIEGYFMAIDRSILWEKIVRVLTRKRQQHFDLDTVLYLLKKVIFNDPTRDCVFKGKKEDWVGLPRNKSLFFSWQGSGLPIGNLTSQLFGNIYLSQFDHFVRERLGMRWYGRYVDDMIFVGQNKKELLRILPLISAYLSRELRLKVHPKKISLQPFFQGVSFLGVYIKPYRMYVGRRIKGNFFERSTEIVRQYSEVRSVSQEENQRTLSVVNAYLGSMGWCRSYTLRKKMLEELMQSELDRHFDISKDFLRIIRLEKKMDL